MISKLIDTIQPEHYNLELQVDPDKMEFHGKLTLLVQLRKDSNEVTVHAKNLEIVSAHINDQKVSHSTYGKNDELTLATDAMIVAGDCEIKFDFTGKITDDMVGMYPCYFEHEGKTKKLIATQFESHHAREVFPCIDEPAAKATFHLTLFTPLGQTVLSNTPVKEQIEVDAQKWINSSSKTTRLLRSDFEETPKMSTYLLAFVFGEMHCQEARTKEGVLVRSWASLAQPQERLNYSLEEAVKLIEFYNEYFDIPYPLSKCDHVALPDFDAGAMENWGLITYRESALLTDPNNRSTGTEQYVSIVVAHELSHQWFGNLVTMKWWDDLWLNESFASLMEYIAVDSLHPQWRMWEEYTAGDAVIASNRDVYQDVQPVRVDVNDPAEISTLFDGAIVYAKGGRLLKMLREFIGEDSFRKGLADYFKKYQFTNTSRDDLWSVLTKASGQDVAGLMNSWLEQSGMPLVSLLQSGKELSATQQRLLLDTNESSDQIWQIPLLSNQQLSPSLLATKQQSFKTTSEDFVLLNTHASGHYVVNYESKQQLAQLANGLTSREINTEGRISSLNDMILLAKAGKKPLSEALELIMGCSDEPRDSVWGMMASVIGNARVLIEGNETSENQLKSTTYELIANKYEELGWEFVNEEDVNTTHLRRTMLSLALGSEHKEVIKQALSRYNADYPETINAETRSLLMSASVRFGDNSTIEQLITLHHKTASSELRSDICAALTSTKSPAVAKRLTDLLLDKDQVRPQDLMRWFAYLLRNRYTREVMWQWMESNWEVLVKLFASSKSYDAFPRYGASFLNTKAWLQRYRAFFEPKRNDISLQRNIDIGIAEITARVDWRDRDEAKIIQWLAKHSR